jgi:hypothetical protein
MADAKISALTNLTAADAINDMIPIVDVSDTPPASGNTKRISINNILSSSPTASGAFSVTGLVTAGSATITGNLTVQTNALFVNSANNNVGLGTLTPSTNLDVYNASSARIAISGPSTATSYLIFRNTTTGTNKGYIGYEFANDAIPFALNGSEAMRLNSTGLNVANGNVILGTSGKGIDFSATTSGSGTMTSELLNDYEEGTWTGTVTGGTFTNLATGRYTKIGRQVFASITPNTTAITGNLVISGLPFTAGARSAMVVATAPPTGVTYIPRFVDATDIYVNVSGTYAGVSESTYFAFTYDV